MRHCRSLDMPLADVRRLLALSQDRGVSCDDVNELVQAHLERVRAKRAALQTLETQLAAVRAGSPRRSSRRSNRGSPTCGACAARCEC